MALDENELIQGIIEKREDYFIELVNLYKKKIMSLCFSYTEDYFEAEDLSQEIFLSLYKNMRNFRGDASLSTYIYKVALSKCVDYKRKRSIKSFLSGLIYSNNEKQEDTDDKNYIRQTIAKLPEELKKVLILFYYIGLTQKEIGEILKITERAVEGRIYRAKQKLRNEFEKEGNFQWKRSGTI